MGRLSWMQIFTNIIRIDSNACEKNELCLGVVALTKIIEYLELVLIHIIRILKSLLIALANAMLKMAATTAGVYILQLEVTVSRRRMGWQVHTIFKIFDSIEMMVK